MTYTLEADFREVQQALDQDEPDTCSSGGRVTSILADDEKEELFRLATIILELYKKYRCNQWNLTLNCDRKIVLSDVLEPARSLYINEDYILDMISTYAEYVIEIGCFLSLEQTLLTSARLAHRHRCDPLKRQYTMLSRYTPSSKHRDLKKLENTLVGHARMIFIMSPNESLRLVLGHALAGVQEKIGIKELSTGDAGRWLIDSPCKPELWKMESALKL